MGSASKLISTLLLMMALVAGCTPEGPVDHSGSLNGREYVDLGLPSGTLWATCNVGADTPEGHGDYFAWGETETKERYDWKFYRYSTFDVDRFVLTKYCTNAEYGYNGFVDSLTVLEPDDDAVRAQWGEGWRMPTKEEYSELYQQTTCIWTTRNGVEGRLLTGKNGNSIFLPAAGYHENDAFVGTSLGIYWSSSLQSTCQVAAFSFHFTCDGCHVCGTYERSRGQCVRAVRSL